MRRQVISKMFPLCAGGAHTQKTIISASRESESRSHNLLLQSGMITSSSPGIYQFLPAFLRSIDKMSALIDCKMQEIGCQKMQMSALASRSLWDKTGRWDDFGDELVKTELGGCEHCLCPTHEEIISDIMHGYLKTLTHSHLPVRMYQSTAKFRNEMRPHYGLLRCREFLMKDLYTFDADEEAAMRTYRDVADAYVRVFEQLDVDVIRTRAGGGLIGGELSHEYHVLSDIGEDTIAMCDDGEMVNVGNADGRAADGQTFRGIELGHTFYLGTQYSDKLNVAYVDCSSKLRPCHMGCFGLGVTRIIAACVETMSADDGLRWPKAIAPYKVCIVPPKKGSREFEGCSRIADKLYDQLTQLPAIASNDVVVDDRSAKSIGWRARHANLIGYPLVLVVGKCALETSPIVEIIEQAAGSRKTHFVPADDVASFVADYYE